MMALQFALLLLLVCLPGLVVAQTAVSESFLLNSRSVTFNVNKANVSETDAQWMADSLMTSLEALDENGQVVVRAAASPEGNYQSNLRLATNRSKAVVSMLKKFGVADSQINVEVVAEDWQMLVALMAANNDADLAAVKAMMEQTNGNTNKMEQALKNAGLWNRLFNEYFAELRAVRFAVVSIAKEVVETPAITTVEAVDTVETFTTNAIEFAEVAAPMAIEFTETAAQNATINMIKMDSIEVLPIEVATEAVEAELIAETAPVAEVATEAVEIAETEDEGSHPILSVKTNLLYDLLYTPQTGFKPAPNLSVEAYFGKRYSVQATFESPWWSNEKKQEYFQYQNLSIEPRIYLKGDRSFNGHFFGVYAQANLFDFALKGNNGSGVQGEGMGAGLSYGYVMPLGKKDSRWKLEFNVKVGFYEAHYDPYDYETNVQGEKKFYYRYYGDSNNFVKRNWRYRWVGPTGVGVSISYDLFKKSNKK